MKSMLNKNKFFFALLFSILSLTPINTLNSNDKTKSELISNIKTTTNTQNLKVKKLQK